MGSRFDQYRVKVGDDLGNPDYWNTPRFKDIDTRLNSLEAQKSTLDGVIEEGRIIFRTRVDDVMIPLVQELDEIAQVGVMFRAASATFLEIGLGGKTLFINENEKDRFAAPAYVSVIGNGDTSKAMLAWVVSYSRATGELVINSQKFIGSGFHDDWIVTAASATDAEDAAQAAIVARDTTLMYRNEAADAAEATVALRDETINVANQAVAANSDAQVAKDEAFQARDETADAISQWTTAVLPPSSVDPITRQGGAPLQVGDQFFKTTDFKWRTWDGTQWTVNAVPLGSEVASVFGRSGSVSAQAGDYRGDQVSRTAGQQAILAGADVEAALQALKSGSQPVNTNLTALAGIIGAADRLAFFTGAGAMSLATFSSFARSLIDDADAATMRGTLGLGSMATQSSSNISVTGGSMSGVTFDDGTF